MIVGEEQSSQGSTCTNPTSPFSWSQLRDDADIEAADIIITGSHSTRYSQREVGDPEKKCRIIRYHFFLQKYGEKLLLRYSQRWVRELSRSRIGLNQPLYAGIDGNFETLTPRHCPVARCLCQYIEEHLRLKPLFKFKFSELFL